MQFPTLYKVTAAKKIQAWSIRTVGQYIITEEGLLDGKRKEHRIEVKDAKRSGSLEEQANAMAASKWADKKKTYWESIEEAQRAGSDLQQGGYAPMLAHEFGKYANKVKFPAYVQPKLDGFRCISRKVDGEVGLFTRKGLPILNMPHIVRSLDRIMEDEEILDGELYIHGMDFNELSGIIRKQDSDTSEVNYVVYDFPKIGKLNETNSYRERFNWIHGLAPMGSDTTVDVKLANNVTLLATNVAQSIEDIADMHGDFVEQGYEGAIVRQLEAPYENKRSQKLLKYKVMHDYEYQIIGYSEGVGALEGCVGSFTCKTADGQTFGCKMKTTNAELKRMFQHPEEFMGRYMTVQYQILSADNVPRFPVGLKIRG